MITPSEQARYARAELEALAASLRLRELARLIELARKLHEQEAGARSPNLFG